MASPPLPLPDSPAVSPPEMHDDEAIELATAAEPLSLMTLPYTVREKIYLEIVNWVGFGMSLGVEIDDINPGLACNCHDGAHHDCTTLSWGRLSEEGDDTRAMDIEELTGMRRIAFINDMGEILDNMPTGAAVAQLLRYPTLLSLMSTNKTIRKDVCNVFWIHLKFRCMVWRAKRKPDQKSCNWKVLDPLPTTASGSAIPPEHFFHPALRLLMRHFADVPIHENIRTFCIILPRRWKRGYRFPNATRRGVRNLGGLATLLDFLPNLIHLKFRVEGTEELTRLHTCNAFDPVFPALRRAEHLKSVHFQSARMTEAQMQLWTSELRPGVSISAWEDQDVEGEPVILFTAYKNWDWGRSAFDVSDDDSDSQDDVASVASDGDDDGSPAEASNKEDSAEGNSVEGNTEEGNPEEGSPEGNSADDGHIGSDSSSSSSPNDNDSDDFVHQETLLDLHDRASWVQRLGIPELAPFTVLVGSQAPFVVRGC